MRLPAFWLLLLILSCVSRDGWSENFSHIKNALVSIKQIVQYAAQDGPGVVNKTGFICDKKRRWIMTTSAPFSFGGVIASYEVTFSGGIKTQARCIYKDPLFNIEVLEFDNKNTLEGSKLTQLNLAVADFKVEQPVILASRKDEKSLVQEGVVSSVHESRGMIMAYQSARISLNTPGALLLGAPVLNREGGVVGMTARAEQTFAASIWGGYLRDVLSALKQGKKPPRFAIEGVHIQTHSLADAAKYLYFPEKHLEHFLKKYPEAFAHGIVVMESRSSAKDLKATTLQVGDIIVQVEGVPVGYSLYGLHQQFSTAPNSEKVAVKIVRQGKEVVLFLKLQNAWTHKIKKMLFFGGGIFYESDLLTERFFNVPLGTVVLSRVFSGNIWHDVFPSMPVRSDQPVFVVGIEEIAGVPITSLEDLAKVIPRLKNRARGCVRYRNYGTYFNGFTLETDRSQRFGQVDFFLSTLSPQVFTFKERTHVWDTRPLFANKKHSSSNKKQTEGG